MRAWILVLALILPAVAQPPAPQVILSAEPEIRILLAASRGPVEITSEGELLALAGERHLWSRRVLVHPGRVEAADGDVLEGDELEVFSAGGPFQLGGNAYRGTLVVLTQGDEVLLINRVAVEDYLKGVVPRELLCGEPEAMKAQAVVARTYAVARLKPGAPFDLGSQTVHQVYGGLSAEHPAASQAVEATRGQLLEHEGSVAREALYHSTCGGRTEDNEKVFRGAPVAYLRSVECGYCISSRHFRWEARLGWKDLSAALGKGGAPLGTLKILSAGLSGHVLLLGVEAPGLSLEVRGDQLRSLLKVHLGDGGPVPLPSTRFALERSEEQGFFRLVGRGWGHGVGMCQWGAIGMARAGFGYREILARYFQGTQVLDAGS